MSALGDQIRRLARSTPGGDIFGDFGRAADEADRLDDVLRQVRELAQNPPYQHEYDWVVLAEDLLEVLDDE